MFSSSTRTAAALLTAKSGGNQFRVAFPNVGVKRNFCPFKQSTNGKFVNNLMSAPTGHSMLE